MFLQGGIFLGEGKGEPQRELEEQDLEVCSNCGRRIPRGTRFCRECGAAQTRDAAFFLVFACLMVIGAVIVVIWITGPYSLAVNIAAPILTLVILALILSLLLWR